ncbi:hypothetical protein QQF64_025867 [Cirrhinus molitorella]|uniref:Uncharacterized protein n=1 Tax=Cirrhinus molitorella TaxID=172907 RepID=A0ABR3NQ94_9TELE
MEGLQGGSRSSESHGGADSSGGHGGSGSLGSHGRSGSSGGHGGSGSSGGHGGAFGHMPPKKNYWEELGFYQPRRVQEERALKGTQEERALAQTLEGWMGPAETKETQERIGASNSSGSARSMMSTNSILAEDSGEAAQLGQGF